MNRDLVVKLRRGLFLRPVPIFEEGVFPVLKYGQHFYAVTTRKIDGVTWAKNAQDKWIPVANGRNTYVEEFGRPINPI